MNVLKNRVMLIGRLGAKPEGRTLANGQQMARFSLATTESYRNSKGERMYDTQWHSLIAWGKTADVVNRFLDKGQEVAVEGKLFTRHYKDQAGARQYVTEVVVNGLLMLGRKQE